MSPELPEAQPAQDAQTEHRGLKACHACRIAKVKCLGGGPALKCARCASAAIECRFSESRRGRVKGSRNRKTLERLAEQAHQRSQLDPKPSPSKPPNTPSGRAISSPPNRLQSSQSDGPSLGPFSRPQSSPRSSNATQPSSSFDRQNLRVLERSFPTGSERVPDSSQIDAKEAGDQDDLHNPLLFLAECARKGWDSTSPWESPLVMPAPVGKLPTEDAKNLEGWRLRHFEKVVEDQRSYFQHGLHGSKRDVGEGLDPVSWRIIVDKQVEPLFDAYFLYCHKQWPMLDRNLHTPEFVRNRSVFLFTVILALGATSLATLPKSSTRERNIATKLFAHVEKLQLVICATAAKSIEIVQAELLSQMWALRTPRLVDDQRAMRLGMAFRMAGQIGLQHPFRHSGAVPLDAFAKNDLMLRVSLILTESRWESIADRKEVINVGFDLTDSERSILHRVHPLDPEAIIASDYALYGFEVESKVRITSNTSDPFLLDTSLDAELSFIHTYLASWESHWVEPQTDPLRRWSIQYAALRSLLVGLLRIAKARGNRLGPWTSSFRKDLYGVSTRILEGVLSHERALHMLRPTSVLVFVSTIVIQLTDREARERDLILRVGLRLAGEAGREEMKTFATHNGFQILNMLCLSREEAGQRRAARILSFSSRVDGERQDANQPKHSHDAHQVSTSPAGSHQFSSSLSSTSFSPLDSSRSRQNFDQQPSDYYLPLPVTSQDLYNVEPRSPNQKPGHMNAGNSGLDQLLAFSLNDVDFPYISDNAMAAASAALHNGETLGQRGFSHSANVSDPVSFTNGVSGRGNESQIDGGEPTWSDLLAAIVTGRDGGEGGMSDMSGLYCSGDRGIPTSEGVGGMNWAAYHEPVGQGTNTASGPEGDRMTTELYFQLASALGS
ncbi:hypothetical protein L202_04730 [Cryptococcus amylolentus CBS 6039]|uniref:Zn(2)-C6 fungal-type domain-containing protein n=1 Tax=Cryptococcus amylolentus CBS 6039 TaxID=1295533 RepID=A0A1E3HMI8_9TREE|nr:hypothetical protein L202_04730 [Cryptococcus amylolentus CBS 6039]ODN77560.1 hypothetical protein L202_04730 [Cryptococcus amylolentus CBS 6039]